MIIGMGKTAFIYPGQGAQYIGMGKDIAEKYPSADRVYKDASESLGFDIEELIFRGEEDRLVITENTQPALLTTCIASTQPLIENGIRADMSAGLSVGEYSAHVLANTITFKDAVRVVKMRGKYMQEEVPAGVGGMAAILGLDNHLVEEVCERVTKENKGLIVEPVNYNCPGQLVIAGDKKAVELACEVCKVIGAKRAVILAVSAPFHSSLLRGAGVKLEKELAGVMFNEMEIPVVSNVSARIIGIGEFVRKTLVDQVFNPVMWEQSVRAMIGTGVDTFVEIGPGKTLSGFVKKIDPGVTVLNVNNLESLESTLDYFKSTQLN